MKPSKSRKGRATDHRALVLESVATAPAAATLSTIVADVQPVAPAFTKHKVASMVWWLRREGLIGDREGGGYFITEAGLSYLTSGRFDRAVPVDHVRPGARKPRKK